MYKLTNLTQVSKIDVQAGHFKPSGTYVEHGLLVMNIAGQTPKVEMFKHGKRQRHTLLIKTTAVSK